jgi:hypothetical protein
VARSTVFSGDGVILNACCLRNICASGCMAAILEACPIPAMIARVVYDQEQPLRILREHQEGAGLVVEHIDLQPILHAGVLVMVSLTSEAEEAKMIDLATILEDGEATTAALALQRGWAIGVDGPATTVLLRQHFPGVQIVSTPILMQQWVEHSRPPSRTLRGALQHIHQGTGYAPPVHHPLYPWWQEVLETKKDEPM